MKVLIVNCPRAVLWQIALLVPPRAVGLRANHTGIQENTIM